ncbi:pseudouridine-5'-phosphate glycosidase [Leekyejoonella antrihumi]|uniref:Pseudouridine-5'-phosphate glycosidase n=1 Tax=Leekyejoonella antrihumi TaxID=1660198 RepID=A0A563DTV4_9MICO|nr:pseudouridine-5'-phosphate glycosidase [Leekyejoonella antrihumi]TWP33675.1 pseudouridine-5'-phosphate glycosidase [Leekyejoonella antrihumi]
MNPAIHLTDEVREALRDHRPVVALESTIISHGMPYPQNVEMAREVEDIIRSHEVVPATIAVLDGMAHVGLTADQLELLASSGDVEKASVRDLAYVLARGVHGATTVAATMRLAHLAGIRVFATGGLGGVHRGAAGTFDISADLTELSRTPVAVVSAGVKSILDIALTMEQLETLSVPVIGYATDEFPAFYSRSSGHRVPMRADSPAQVARIMHTQWGLGITAGVNVANPIPVDDEVPADTIDAIIDQALSDMGAARVTGKDATPYLLARIVELTGGDSLRANIALVRSNAHLAAQIAAEYVEIEADVSTRDV